MNLYFVKKIRPLYHGLIRLRWVGGRCVMRLCHAAFGVRPKRVFFSSFKGRDYSDSPARISEQLHALRPDAEIVWQLWNAEGAPDYVRVVRPRSLAALRAISTARCLVDNFNRPQYMLKFPDQRYVQTWHGDRGFKKMLYDMEDGQFFPDGAQMDLGVSGSEFGTKNYRTAFHYEGEVLQLGMPRNDILLSRDTEAAKAARRKLGLGGDERVMLYMPTFRNDRRGGEQPAGFDLGLALDRLEAATGRPWRCLTRAHSKSLRVDGGGDDPRVRDVSAWPETSELLLSADLLISDYSSAAGDFVLLDRPVILYQEDIDRFISGDRQMYFDLRTCPYPRAESQEQLLALLDDIDALRPACAKVREFYGVTETGHSARAVAEWISAALDDGTGRKR